MSPTVEQIEIGLYDPSKEKIQLGRHSGQVVEGLLLCRIRTSDGLVGFGGLTTYTEHGIDRSIFSSAYGAAQAVLGADAGERELIHHNLWRRYDFLRAQSSSLIDLALWDVAAKAAGIATEIQSRSYAITQAANLHMMLTTASRPGSSFRYPRSPTPGVPAIHRAWMPKGLSAQR